MEHGLAVKGVVRLEPDQRQRLYAFLLRKCWEMSGLQADGKTLRYVWEIRGFIAPSSQHDPYVMLDLPQEGSKLAAERALAVLVDELAIWGRRVAFVSIVKVRPRGAYDPARGLQFSSYSFRFLSNQRIDDWYRSDPDFGDTRYERAEELSLEGLARRLNDDGDEMDGELPVPASRLEVVDQLNRHHYRDRNERAHASETFGERVVAHEALGL